MIYFSTERKMVARLREHDRLFLSCTKENFLMNLTRLRFWIKSQKTPLSRFLYTSITQARHISLPAPKIIFTPILFLHHGILSVWRKFTMFFYWKPLFSQHLESVPKHLNLMLTMPSIIGNPLISVGEYCTINGNMTIIGRTSQKNRPKLTIGNKVFIGYGTGIFIGNEIIIGDYCLISEGCILRGYPGHPLDPASRLAGLAEDESQVGKIVLEKNVWLGQGVKINPGVTIGENSVIATGSIVTKDIPANVLAAGVPAKIIKTVGVDKGQ